MAPGGGKPTWKKTIHCPRCKLSCNGLRGMRSHLSKGSCVAIETCPPIPICEPTPAECGQMNFAGTSDIFNDLLHDDGI